MRPRNHAGLQGGSPLARAVHDSGSPVRTALFAIALGGCVIPPSLSVDNQDAGVNSPPAILKVRSDDQEFPEPGPILFEVGRGDLNAELIDTDFQDKLFVRIFVDYTVDRPTAARALCTASPTGNADRTVTCSLNALCLSPDDIGQTRLMSIKVFDREPLENGDPAFQEMPEGGLSTGKFFQLQCQDLPL